MSYVLENWYIIPIFIVLIAATVFAWIKAIASGQRRKEERERIIAAIEKEKALRKEFATLDDSIFSDNSIDSEKLLFGVAMNIQMSVEKLDDMVSEFNKLNEVKRNVYALSFIFEDSKYTALSEFFNINGEPLLSQAKNAVDTVIGGKFAEIFNKQYVMYDDNNEEVSFDADIIAQIDNEYASFLADNKETVLNTVSRYIVANKSMIL